MSFSFYTSFFPDFFFYFCCHSHEYREENFHLSSFIIILASPCMCVHLLHDNSIIKMGNIFNLKKKEKRFIQVDVGTLFSTVILLINHRVRYYTHDSSKHFNHDPWKMKISILFHFASQLCNHWHQVTNTPPLPSSHSIKFWFSLTSLNEITFWWFMGIELN